MKRFRKYFDETLNAVNAKNADQLCVFGVSCKSISDPLEDFDEVEFITGFADQEVLISIVIQLGKIKRIQFTLVDTENPDAVKGLSDSQIKDLLVQKGDKLIGFFDYITQS